MLAFMGSHGSASTPAALVESARAAMLSAAQQEARAAAVGALLDPEAAAAALREAHAGGVGAAGALGASLRRQAQEAGLAAGGRDGGAASAPHSSSTFSMPTSPIGALPDLLRESVRRLSATTATAGSELADTTMADHPPPPSQQYEGMPPPTTANTSLPEFKQAVSRYVEAH